MAQATIGISVADVLTSSSAPAFRLGTVGGLDHPTNGYQEFVYGRANGAITGAGYACVEATGNDWTLATVTVTTPGTQGFGHRVGMAQAAIADNGFGWFQIYGKGSLRTLASAAKGTRLNTTATGGALDDDGTLGSEAVFGIVLGTATGAAEATNSDALISYPTVGTTL